MVRFLDSFKHRIAKGQVSLPRAFVEALKGATDSRRLFMIYTPQNFLMLAPTEIYAKLLAQVKEREYPSKDRFNRAVRMFAANTHELVLDSQDRLVIPDRFREKAGLTGDEVVFVGCSDYIEVHDAARWEALIEEDDAIFRDLMGDITPGGLE
ncbi:MAG: division/cell wall cluster transcriptional repressor MraZ [Planctomycetota bacterium]